MSNRKIVPVVVGLLLFVVVVGLVAVMWSPGGDAGRGGDDEVATTPDEVPEAAPRRVQPLVPKRRWQVEGFGSVVGIVKEYGTDRPLPGVAVSLEAGLPGPDEVIRTTTNSDGSFVVEKAVNFDEWLLRITPAAPLAEQILNAVEVVADKPTNVGVIYVTPTYEVPGIVVDQQGDPIHGALVRVLRPRVSGSSMDFLRLIRDLPAPPPAAETATTDVEGKFVLSKVSPGSYDIEVSAEQFTQRTERGIPLSPEAVNRPLRFVLTRGFELLGRVVRPSGGNVEGLPVVAFNQPRSELDMFTADRRYAVTDEKGGFRLTGLAAGQLIVAVTPEGEPFTVKADVTVPGTDFLELVIQGDAWIEGRVSDAEDKPVEGASVFAAVFDSGQPIVGTADTDQDGRYRIDGMRAGPLQLFLVQAEGFGSYPDDLSSVMRGRGAGVTLKPGENVRDVVLGAGSIVRGTVLDRDSGAPIEGATIRLLSVMAFFGGERQGVSGADGVFEITSVPQGQAMISVSKEGYFQPGVNAMSMGMMLQGGMNRSGAAPADSGRGAIISVTEPGQIIEREIKLAPGSVIRGVVQTPDGEPVPGARITLEQQQGQGPMRMISSLMASMDPRLSQDGGRYQIPGPPPGSQASVVANAPGWLEGRTEPLAMGPGEVREDVIVTLRRGAVVEGVVKGADGKPLVGALVRWLAVGADGVSPWQVKWELRRATPSVTGDGGLYRLENVEPGKIIVQADHAEHLAATQTDVEVTEAKGVTLDFQLERGGEITGKVLGPDGKSYAGARIDVTYRGQGDPYEYTQQPDNIVVGADGTFEIQALAPGTYDIFARAEGAAPSATAKVQPGAPAVTLRLSPAFRVAGYVRFDDGGPAASVQVQLLRKHEKGEESVDSERTGEDGAFAFENQPAGTYTVRTGGWNWGGNATQVVPVSVDDVQAGQENVLLTVSRGLSIAGTVTGGDGGSQQMGWVSVSRVHAPDDPPGSNINTGVQLAEGKFEVGGLTPGSYQLNVNIGGRNRSLRVDAGTTDVLIEFGRGGTIRGHVRLPDGSPAVGANVTAARESENVSAQTDGQGAYEILDAPVGTVSVGAWQMSDGKPHTGRVPEVSVGAGDDVAGIDITLEVSQPPR